MYPRPTFYNFGSHFGRHGFGYGWDRGIDNIDNMSYEQLLQLFPNLPRGANENDIQALPTDEYKEYISDTDDKDDKEHISDKDDKKNKKDGKNELDENLNENESKTNNENKKDARKRKRRREKEKRVNKCSICLEEFKNGDLIRRLPCMHIFHTQEIDTWLRQNHVCPICRIPIDHNQDNNQDNNHQHAHNTVENNPSYHDNFARNGSH